MSAESDIRVSDAEKIFQYHCRYLQVDALLADANSILSAESIIIQEQGVFLFHLLNTPPIIWEGIMKHKEALESAAIAVRALAKRDLVRLALGDLLKAAKDGVNWTREIPIDRDFINQPEFERIFVAEPERLDEARLAGREDAVKFLLELIESPQHPLLPRLRRDLARRNGTLIVTVDGGAVAYFPTKIPEVKVRYYYPPDEDFPRLSLLVNPFE